MESTTSKKVSVIVLNLNGRQLLERFLPSVRGLEYDNCETIIMDDASTDESVKFVRKNYPEFRVVENGENQGTAEGSNVGVRNANGDYIIWLGNDMEIDSQLIKEMVKTAESDSSIGIVGCKVLKLDKNNEKTDIIDTVGADLDIYGFIYPRGHNEIDRQQWNFETDVFFAFGCSLLIKREVFDKIGGYDPKYFTLADDTDLCWRAKLAGYRVVVNPTAIIYHKLSATLGTAFRRSRLRYFAERNTLRTLLKNYSTWTLVKVLPRYFALLTAEVLFFLVTRRFRLALADIKAVWWNIRNIRDTWSLHRQIQQSRVIADSELQKGMIGISLKVGLFKRWMKGEHVI